MSIVDAVAGCSMIVYDLRASRITMAYRSQLHVDINSLLLTPDLSLMIAAQTQCIVLWRLKDLGSTAAYNKYMTDDAPADDEELSDADYYYDDAADDTDLQVSLLALL